MEKLSDYVNLTYICWKDSILHAGNPIKEILPKLNLPDHMSILTDSQDSNKDGVEVPDSSCCSRQVKIHSHMLILDRQM
ncbi:hypothetical protein Tco_1359597 [Tanacetum coccineum]